MLTSIKTFIPFVLVGVVSAAAGGIVGFSVHASSSVGFHVATVDQITGEIKTVTWYKEHRPEMRTKIAACNDNPGLATSDPECLNASDANDKLGLERLIGSGE